jgi:holo-[acyl-carrier protein] synthase
VSVAERSGSVGAVDRSGSTGVVGVGIDAVDVARLSEALTRTPTLEGRLFTSDERAYCTAGGRPAERFAVRFAAKEAAMKALGVGLGGIGWHDVEVVRAPSGAPSLAISGRAAELAAEAGGTRWHVSLTHTGTVAQAIVLLTV